MNTTNAVVIPFSIALQEHIKTLNVEWLERYFKVEPKDELVLSVHKKEIIEKDGFIYYAKYKDRIVNGFFDKINEPNLN
jgi:hypothetical protein